MNRYAVIMAAGKGTRMKSNREDMSKVSFPVLGRPMVKWVLEALRPINPDKIVTIVGFGGEMSKAIVEKESEVVWQNEQKGTGHAVMMCAPLLEGKEGETIVCCGDTPLLRSETFQAMFEAHEQNHNDLTVLTAIAEEPKGYGRIIKKDGQVTKIVEQKDCTPEEAAVKEINAGVYIFDNKALFEALKQITPNNKAGEYYLTDVIALFVKAGKRVDSFILSDFAETMGVNDRYHLSIAAEILRDRINKAWMLEGVSMDDPKTTYISPDAKIGRDTLIRANTYVMGESVIGENCVLGPNAYIENAKIIDGATASFGSFVDRTIEK